VHAREYFGETPDTVVVTGRTNGAIAGGHSERAVALRAEVAVLAGLLGDV
jgi:hypothetical protein